jgi:hypothetical protein
MTIMVVAIFKMTCVCYVQSQKKHNKEAKTTISKNVKTLRYKNPNFNMNLELSVKLSWTKPSCMEKGGRKSFLNHNFLLDSSF